MPLSRSVGFVIIAFTVPMLTSCAPSMETPLPTADECHEASAITAALDASAPGFPQPEAAADDFVSSQGVPAPQEAWKRISERPNSVTLGSAPLLVEVQRVADGGWLAVSLNRCVRW